jgi:hypothetical protein
LPHGPSGQRCCSISLVAGVDGSAQANSASAARSVNGCLSTELPGDMLFLHAEDCDLISNRHRELHHREKSCPMSSEETAIAHGIVAGGNTHQQVIVR